MMITKLFGIPNREMARWRGENAKGHANWWSSRKHGSTSSRKREYQYKNQVVTGKRLGGHNQKVDVLAWRAQSEQIPISLKWQQTSGTAEQKVPFEILCLADAVHKSRGRFNKAYLVLGGSGWTLREFYVSGQIREYLKDCEVVEIVSLETFVATANQSEL